MGSHQLGFYFYIELCPHTGVLLGAPQPDDDDYDDQRTELKCTSCSRVN
jgi:hypothetical protein